MDAPTQSFGERVDSNRREAPDRRKKHVLFADWRYAFGGRRRNLRRSRQDLENGVDQYGPKLVLMTVAVLVLSALDAIFTLTLMREGIVEEANPFMRALMERDIQLFANVKIVLTVFALIFLVVCYHSRIWRARIPISWIFKATLIGYTLLICYELFLLNFA